jgi:hypothetical protein
MLDLGETSQSLTHCLPDSPSKQAQVLSPKARSPNWHITQSQQITSSAYGAGLRKTKKIIKSKLPCMDSYANVTPDVTPNDSFAHSAVNICQISFHPNSNLMQNPVTPPIDGELPSSNVEPSNPLFNTTNLSSLQSSNPPEPRIRLQLVIDDASDTIFTHVHVYEGLGHRLLQSDGTNILVPPKGPFCQKNGKIRKNYILPQFNNRHNWSLKDQYFVDIIERANSYDATNGQIFPPNHEWVDAFADPNGTNAKFKQFFSPLNNAFKHNWSDANVYAFPPMHDETITKTLQYHIAQQQLANTKGTAFRGIYLVPYQPRATYWSLTSNFQLLKYFRAGTPMFETIGKHGKSHPISSIVPMCALYDMGYSTPDYQVAYLNAMDLASSALDRCTFDYPLDNFDWDCNSKIVSNTPTNTCQLTQTTTTPKVNHILSTIKEEIDGGIEDFTPTNIFSKSHPSENNKTNKTPFSNELGDLPNKQTNPFSNELGKLTNLQTIQPTHNHPIPKAENPDPIQLSSQMARVRIQNMLFTSKRTSQLPSQVKFTPTRDEVEIKKFKSIGKLNNILEEDTPDWDDVDASVAQHIQTLKAMKDQEEEQADTGIEPVDPSLFTKTWEEGGLLPKAHIRHIQGKDEVLLGETCMVIRTKTQGKYLNTTLIDEGATESVLNIDWYEAQGIDWRKEFGLSPDAQPGVVQMANHAPVPTYGKATANMKITGVNCKSFDYPFHFLTLGKYNYAQILGIDWKNDFQLITFNHEYKIYIRKLKVEVMTKAMSSSMYQMMYNQDPNKEAPPLEESNPKQINKDIRMLTARLQRMSIHIPPTAFLRQIVVRPIKPDEDNQNNHTIPKKWKPEQPYKKGQTS